MSGEGDIWDYVSLKRSRVNAQTPVSVKKRQKPNSSPAASPVRKVTKRKKTARRKQSPYKGKKQATNSIFNSSSPKTPPKQTKDAFDGFCPNCQMPFKILHIKSPKWHVSDCMETSLSSKECPEGVSCDSEIPSHYRKWSHSVLAAQRAGHDPNEEPCRIDIKTDLTTNSDFNSDVTSCVGKEDPTCSSDDPGTIRDSSDVTSCVRREDSSDTNADLCTNRSDVTSCAETHVELNEADINSVDTHIHVLDSDMSSGSPSQLSMIHTSGEAKSTRRLFFKMKEVVSGKQNLKKNKDENSEDDIFSQLDVWPKSDVECVKPQVKSNQKLCLIDNDTSSSVQTMKIKGLTYRESDVNLPHHTKTVINEETRNDMCNNVDIDDVMSVCSELDQELEPSGDVNKTSPISTSQEEKSKGNLDINVANPDTSDVNEHCPSNTQGMTNNVKAQSSITAFFRPVNPGNTSKKRSVVQETQSHKNQGSSSTVAAVKKNTPLWKPKPTTQTSTSSQQDQSTKQKYSGRKCPFYKKLPFTPFTVDAFRYGVIEDCQAYFLSHFHYDHYMGLNKHFKQPIYCSKVTGNLVKAKLKVAAEYVHSLPMNEVCVVLGIEVILLEANHCPGAVMFLFKLPNGRTYLHTGDFRADESMESYTVLTESPIDSLYLDTTYCDPTYTFPPQSDVIQFAVSIVVNAIAANSKTLIVCGSYTIGKERIFVAMANALGCKVCVSREKKSVLDCLEDKEMGRLVTLNGNLAQLHVVSMSQLNIKGLNDYLQKFRHLYDNIIAFKPTGWTHNEKVTTLSDIKPVKKGAITIYGVPYSEHSSYNEMKRFVQFLKPKKIVPTVNNGSAQARKKMEDHFALWLKGK